MTDQEKKNYNKVHYQKNRAAILGRVKAKYKPKKQSILNVIPLFKGKGKEPDKTDPRGPKLVQIAWGTVFLQIFVAAMTGFLVNETARFYASVDGTAVAGYLKALILEGAVFAFALMKARTAFTGAVYRLMIMLVYSYSAWAISSSVIQNAFKQHSQISFHQKLVTELESEIMKKTTLRDSLLESKRLTLALKIDQTLNTLKLKLENSRDALLKVPEPTVLWNTLLTLVVFRVLTMITNLLCLRELGRRYRVKLRTA